MTDNKREQFLNKVNDMISKHLYMSANKLSNTLTIGGAGNKFKRNPDTIYVPKYRLAGHIDDILQVVKLYDLDADLGDYYTVDNYTNSTAYTEEVNARKEYQGSLKKNDQDQVLDLIKNIDKCRIRLPSIFDRRPNTKKSRVRRTNVQRQVQNTEDTVQNDGIVEDITEIDDATIKDEEIVLMEEATVDTYESDTDEDTVHDTDNMHEDAVQNDTDNVQAEDTVSVHTDEEIEAEKEQDTHIIEDVRMERPRSPKRYPTGNRTRLNRSVPIEHEVKKSTRTKLAPIIANTVPPVKNEQLTLPSTRYSEDSSTRRRLKPIIN